MRLRFVSEPRSSRARRSLVLLPAALLLAFLPALAGGSTVRGRVVRGGPQGDHPAPGVAVTLVSADPRVGESARAYSSSEGMYYLYNVPPGRYSLRVWVTPRSVVRVPVSVGTGPYTDVRPVRVP